MRSDTPGGSDAGRTDRPGTLSAQSIGSGISVGPREGRTIVFGRQADEVHVCVGADDQGVSRKHGLLVYGDGHWRVHNTGRRPIHLPSGDLFTNAEPVPLADGYTPLFVGGSGRRRHLLELFIVGEDGKSPLPLHNHETHSPKVWPLSRDERLALTVLGQRYLRNEPNPQPLGRREAATELSEIDPDGRWTLKRVENRANAVRHRLSKRGVPGLVAKEVAQPIGNQLNDNLLRELLRTGTLTPADLALLDDWADSAPG